MELQCALEGGKTKLNIPEIQNQQNQAKDSFSYLVHFSFLYHILRYILDYLWTQDQEDDLQWPHCCLTFRAFSKAIH